MRAGLVALAITLLSGPLRAQVGALPEKSPFRDVEERSTVTLFSGYYGAGTDPAKVAPGSATLLGARYDFNVGSAGSIYIRGATALSKRTPIDPLLAAGSQSLGKRNWPVTALDVGFNLALTGPKSYHHIIPSLSAGIGIVSDFIIGEDIGGYSFGTQFLFTYGAGLRFITSDRTSIRVDVLDYLHRSRYPDSYFQGATPLLTDTSVRSAWRHNLGLQVGLQYAVFR
jgi:hypothetical protein